MATKAKIEAQVLDAVDCLDDGDLKYMLAFTTIRVPHGTWTEDCEAQEVQANKVIAALLPGHPLPGATCFTYNKACKLIVEERKAEQWEVIE